MKGWRGKVSQELSRWKEEVRISLNQPESGCFSTQGGINNSLIFVLIIIVIYS